MPLEDYVDASRRRFATVAASGMELVDAPGVIGVRPAAPGPVHGRLLVTDDRAADLVREELPRLRMSPLAVVEGAPACEQLVREAPGWVAQDGTAMVRGHLDDLDVPLPPGLALVPVRRRPEDDPAGVPLEAAVEVCLAADPEEAALTSVARLSSYLRSLPGARLFAAVDDSGTVRATAGSAASDGDCGVFFVSTEQSWRGRGVGTAMTAAALRDARDHGARRACLDGSPAGRPIYARLGFDAVARITRFFPQP